MPAKKIINPLTGRKVTVGGAAYKKMLKQKKQTGGSSTELQNLRKFDTAVLQQQSDKFFTKLAKGDAASRKPVPTKLAATSDMDTPVIPKSKYNLLGSSLPPAPSGSHSYYHHHSPFSQDFGDYVCLKKDTLRDLGMFLRDSMFRSVDN